MLVNTKSRGSINTRRSCIYRSLREKRKNNRRITLLKHHFYHGKGIKLKYFIISICVFVRIFFKRFLFKKIFIKKKVIKNIKREKKNKIKVTINKTKNKFYFNLFVRKEKIRKLLEFFFFFFEGGSSFSSPFQIYLIILNWKICQNCPGGFFSSKFFA